MMKFKKFLAAAMTGVMMFGMVATAAPAICVYAEGEEANSTRADLKVIIDYPSLTATIESTAGDKYVLLEVLKMKNDQPDGDKVSATYSYPLSSEGKVTVDLSFLNLSKACAIRARGDADNMKKASQYEIVKNQDKKQSLKYTPAEKEDKTGLSKGKSFVTKDGVIGDENVKNYEFKTLYGTTGENFEEFDIDTAAMAGTTLMLRKAAIPEGENQAPAGAETKVKVAAAPKAPKVKVDYGKGTITLPKGTEVKVLYSADNSAAAPTVGENEAKFTFKVIGDYYAQIDTGAVTKVTNENVSAYFELDAVTGDISIKTGVTFFSDENGANKINNLADNFSTYIVAEPVQTTTPTNTVHAESAAKPVGERAIAKTPVEVLDFCGIDAAQQEKIIEAGFVVAVYTPAAYDKKKATSNMALIHVGEAETPNGETPGKVTMTAGASLSWEDDGTNVEFTAKDADFEYVISENGAAPTATTKWTTVKQGRSVKKRSTDIVGKSIYVRQAGSKTKGAEKLPSNPVLVKVEAKGDEKPNTPVPVEVFEAKTNLSAWEEGVIYYSDAEGTQEVDIISVTVPVAGNTYYVKAIYTPVPASVTTPDSNATYYTTTDKKVFTEATLTDNKFAENTTYYTREEAKKASTPEA